MQNIDRYDTAWPWMRLFPQPKGSCSYMEQDFLLPNTGSPHCFTLWSHTLPSNLALLNFVGSSSQRSAWIKDRLSTGCAYPVLPFCVVVEAKRGDFAKGEGQLVAEMVAFSKWINWDKWDLNERKFMAVLSNRRPREENFAIEFHNAKGVRFAEDCGILNNLFLLVLLPLPVVNQNFSLHTSITKNIGIFHNNGSIILFHSVWQIFLVFGCTPSFGF